MQFFFYFRNQICKKYLPMYDEIVQKGRLKQFKIKYN